MPISANVVLGRGVKILTDLVNLYGCTLGDDTKVGAFVKIQETAFIGSQCKISSDTFICEGVTIDDAVFVWGHIHQRPVPTRDRQRPPAERRGWQGVPMRLKRSASNGSGATILAGVTIGECALIGAVAGVTDDVPDHHIARRVPGWTGRSVLEKQL